MNSRVEHDALGEGPVPADALYGIHTARALNNFRLAGRPVHPALIRAYGAVKLAAVRTNHALGRWDEGTFRAIEQACREMMDGGLDRHVLVDALQGGAGTSTNMNVNEVLANRALQIRGWPPGAYDRIHPLDDLNLHQSTNDTYPTALRVAAMLRLRALEQRLVRLVAVFQRREQDAAHVVRLARTEMQDAVLTTMGRTMSAYAEAFSRDRWRISQCEERLRVVNLGGTAIGTGLAAPRAYIFRVVDELRAITGLGLARAENLVEATQNADAFVEVSGILKACAASLLKVSGDLRFLSSGPHAGIGEIRLAPRQAGSSIMPGKINPVEPEAVSQAALLVMAGDQALTHACAAGHLELNPFLPLIADQLLGNVDLLAGAAELLASCAEDLQINEEVCRRHVDNATATATALVGQLGFERVSQLVRTALASGRSIRQLALEETGMNEAEFDACLAPEAVLRLGERGAPQAGPAMGDA